VIGGEYVVCRGDERHVQSFGGETGNIETTLNNKDLGECSITVGLYRIRRERMN